MKHASHVMVVKNLAQSQQYYKDILGFTIDGEFVMREGVYFLFKESSFEGAVRPNSLIGVVLDLIIPIIQDLLLILKNQT
jgi:catechol 2,3-dioxygenase-like lactoylglutathione lyase family enzyme